MRRPLPSCLPPTLPHHRVPGRPLHKIRLNLQFRANDLRDDISAMKRRLTDFENHAVSSQCPRKQRKRHNRAADADKSIKNPNTLEDRTREKGRLFTIQEALFLVDDTVFEVEEDEDFGEGTEFSTDKNKTLRQVLRYLPNDAKPFRLNTVVSAGFADGMSGQRSTTSNRLRDASLAKIVDDIKPFMSFTNNLRLTYSWTERRGWPRTAAIPVPRGICSTTARANVVVERPV
ncbi:hypothetical protein B0H14DRAFT_3494848 [Mycena olivaceomarginata]|nr:hypothetical protein B0H14DRAFT_3494848 [Mycena olivaceomarginata]